MELLWLHIDLEYHKIGRVGGGAQMFVTIGAIAHSHLGGLEACFPRNFGILDSLRVRVFLRHSEGHFFG